MRLGPPQQGQGRHGGTGPRGHGAEHPHVTSQTLRPKTDPDTSGSTTR